MNWRLIATWGFRLLPFGLEIMKIFNKKETKMSELQVKYGTEASEKLLTIIANMVITGWKAGKDGITISDITVLPSLLIDIVSLIQKVPDVSDEVRDLELDEMKDIIVKAVAEVQRVIAEVK